MTAPSAPTTTLVAQPGPRGGRLAYYRRAADAAYWDELWESRPVDYRRARTGHLPPHLDRAVRRRLRPGGRVLEAGCGPGEFTVALAARGFDAEAVDWAPRTVERLRVAAPEIRAWQGDVRRLDVPDGRYDAVYSPGVCEHFEEGPEEVLRETLRVLRPGGTALVSTPCFSPLLRALLRGTRGDEARGGQDRAPAGEFYQYAFTPRGLGAVLRDVGFVRVRAHPYGAFATVWEYTAAGRALSARVPRRRLLPLEAGLDLTGAAWLSGRACLWTARRPVGPPVPGQRPRAPEAQPPTVREQHVSREDRSV
ncbi:Putative 3-demethylubiquinone-9 3-O-methyltransferase (fragment) [Frankia canadensis]|uniref:3-demethylubiquinone-9 3-O-methyltransferase n=1 Tax=Frankia canadensis TaxID=1836972 RepID=A0A2I2KQA2_9ACTN